MHSVLILFSISAIYFVVSASDVRESDVGGVGEPLYLTQYIENGDIEKVQQLALVTHPDTPIESYAGYLTVNTTFNSNMYFLFFPADENPDDAPVVLWLHGGPGVPSLMSTFIEDGPYKMEPSKKLIPNEYSWHRNFECALDGHAIFRSLFTNVTGSLTTNFLQEPKTRRAIHVGNNPFYLPLEGANKIRNYMRIDFMDSVADWVAQLLSHYPILFYNGQLDISGCAYQRTVNSLKQLQFSSANEYKTAKRQTGWKFNGSFSSECW